MAELAMTYVEKGYRSLDWKKKLGYFCWVRRALSEDGWQCSVPDRGTSTGYLCLAIILPGEQAVTFLPVEPCPEWLNGGVHWEWNGNEEAPTLTPSVDGSEQGGWHGHITDGEMK